MQNFSYLFWCSDIIKFQSLIKLPLYIIHIHQILHISGWGQRQWRSKGKSHFGHLRRVSVPRHQWRHQPRHPPSRAGHLQQWYDWWNIYSGKICCSNVLSTRHSCRMSSGLCWCWAAAWSWPWCWSASSSSSPSGSSTEPMSGPGTPTARTVPPVRSPRLSTVSTLWTLPTVLAQTESISWNSTTLSTPPLQLSRYTSINVETLKSMERSEGESNHQQ